MMLPAKIRHRIRVEQAQDRVPGPCWVWTSYQNGHGYGQITIDRKQWMAHRLTYTLLIGPIPAGLQIDHLCRNPSCVNPRHLDPVTNLENALRSDRATRTHCIRGHELSGDNLIVKKPGDRGRRACRTCRNLKIAERDERLRAARRLARAS